jgi:hypothetical protein
MRKRLIVMSSLIGLGITAPPSTIHSNGSVRIGSLIIAPSLATGHLFVNGLDVRPPFTTVAHFALNPDTLWQRVQVNGHTIWKRPVGRTRKERFAQMTIRERQEWSLWLAAQNAGADGVDAGEPESVAVRRILQVLRQHPQVVDSARIRDGVRVLAFPRASSVPVPLSIVRSVEASEEDLEGIRRETLPSEVLLIVKSLSEGGAVLISNNGMMLTPRSKTPAMLAAIDSIRAGTATTSKALIPAWVRKELVRHARN